MSPRSDKKLLYVVMPGIDVMQARQSGWD